MRICDRFLFLHPSVVCCCISDCGVNALCNRWYLESYISNLWFAFLRNAWCYLPQFLASFGLLRYYHQYTGNSTELGPKMDIKEVESFSTKLIKNSVG